jgi:hypothetical protein
MLLRQQKMCKAREEDMLPGFSRNYKIITEMAVPP